MSLTEQVAREHIEQGACRFLQLTHCQPVLQAYAYACHCAQVHCTTEAGGRQVPPLLPQFRSEVEAELPDSATILPLETPGVSAAIVSPAFARRNYHVCSYTVFMIASYCGAQVSSSLGSAASQP